MAMFIFFGGTSLVILAGIATIVVGVRHHYLEGKKNPKP
jgi:hypothetical protein